MSNKRYILFAGVNGAGKSTLYEILKNQNVKDFGKRLNTDEVVKEMNADWKDDKAQITAAREIIRLFNDYIEEGNL